MCFKGSVAAELACVLEVMELYDLKQIHGVLVCSSRIALVPF